MAALSDVMWLRQALKALWAQRAECTEIREDQPWLSDSFYNIIGCAQCAIFGKTPWAPVAVHLLLAKSWQTPQYTSLYRGKHSKTNNFSNQEYCYMLNPYVYVV